MPSLDITPAMQASADRIASRPMPDALAVGPSGIRSATWIKAGLVVVTVWASAVATALWLWRLA